MKESSKKPLNIIEASNNNDENVSIVKFVDGQFQLDVKVDYGHDTVWLSLNELSLLFDRDKSVLKDYLHMVIK